MYELMVKIALTFSVINPIILYFVLTKMIDCRNKALAVFHVLSRHCGVLSSLNKVINGEVKNESTANK